MSTETRHATVLDELAASPADAGLLLLLRPLVPESRVQYILSAIQAAVATGGAKARQRPANEAIDAEAVRLLPWLWQAAADEVLLRYTEQREGRYFVTDGAGYVRAEREELPVRKAHLACEAYQLLPGAVLPLRQRVIAPNRAADELAAQVPFTQMRTALWEVILGQWCETRSDEEADRLFGFFIEQVFAETSYPMREVAENVLGNHVEHCRFERIDRALVLVGSAPLTPRPNASYGLGFVVARLLVGRTERLCRDLYLSDTSLSTAARRLGQVFAMDIPSFSDAAWEQLVAGADVRRLRSLDEAARALLGQLHHHDRDWRCVRLDPDLLAVTVELQNVYHTESPEVMAADRSWRINYYGGQALKVGKGWLKDDTRAQMTLVVQLVSRVEGEAQPVWSWTQRFSRQSLDETLDRLTSSGTKLAQLANS